MPFGCHKAEGGTVTINLMCTVVLLKISKCLQGLSVKECSSSQEQLQDPDGLLESQKGRPTTAHSKWNTSYIFSHRVGKKNS